MPTHMIVVAGPKGGTGKSTTASNLLVAARMAGVDAVGIDLDPQGSLMTWSQDRTQGGREPSAEVLRGRLTDWRDALAVGSRLAVVDLAPGLDEERELTSFRDLAL